MKKVLFCTLMFTGVSTMLTGCVAPNPFVPKALNEKAKGITTVRSTPYGCKVLGEVEGVDESKTSPHDLTPLVAMPTMAELRQGAMNDLRNNAAEVVGKSKRITLRVIDEKLTCYGNGACPSDIQDNHIVKRFSVTAQIFECGKKD